MHLLLPASNVVIISIDAPLCAGQKSGTRAKENLTDWAGPNPATRVLFLLNEYPSRPVQALANAVASSTAGRTATSTSHQQQQQHTRAFDLHHPSFSCKQPKTARCPAKSSTHARNTLLALCIHQTSPASRQKVPRFRAVLARSRGNLTDSACTPSPSCCPGPSLRIRTCPDRDCH